MTSAAHVAGQGSNTLAMSPEARDWATLPQDALLEIFLRLDAHDILRNVDVVCKDWRRVAVEEPMLWRRVDMTSVPLDEIHIAVGDVVDRSKGLLEAFSGPWDDFSLLYIGNRAPSLKSLHLSYNDDAIDEILMLAITKLPLLEYLDISPPLCDLGTRDRLFESVCEACPLLKTLKIRFTLLPDFYFDGEGVLMVPIDVDLYRTPMMRELQSIELFNHVFNNEQLSAILDNCPLLESLHITGHYVDGEMDEQLRAKCGRVKNLSIPFEFIPSEEDSGHSSFCEEDEFNPWEEDSGYSSFSEEDEFINLRKQDSGYSSFREEDEFNPREEDSGH